MKYKDYLEERVAPHINEIAKERDYTKVEQVQELFKSIKDMMCCETVAYFTPHSLDREKFFIPKGYFYSDKSFREDIELDYQDVFIQKPLSSVKYFLLDTRTKDKIEPPFEEIGIRSVLAVSTEDELSYGVLFALNGAGIEKSQFNPSFNILQCNIFLLISKMIDLPTTYEMNLKEEMEALKDKTLIGHFVNNLANLQQNERLVGGINTYYRKKREISFLLLTRKRIISIVQTCRDSHCSTFFFRDIVSINPKKRYIRGGQEKIDIEIEFSKGSLTWQDADATYDTERFLRNIGILAAMKK